MKVVVGLGGPNGAGKGTLFRLCAQILKEAGVEAARHSSGDIIRDCLRLCNLPASRPNAQKFVEAIEANIEKGFLSSAMRARLSADSSQCSFFDGVRLASDLDMLESIRDDEVRVILVFVSAAASARFDRMRLRREKAGEETLSREEFLAQENAATEQDLPKVEARAHYVIDNSGAPEKLKEAATMLCYAILLYL